MNLTDRQTDRQTYNRQTDTYYSRPTEESDRQTEIMKELQTCVVWLKHRQQWSTNLVHKLTTQPKLYTEEFTGSRNEKAKIVLTGKPNDRTTECHLSCEITQSYLPPDTSERTLASMNGNHTHCCSYHERKHHKTPLLSSPPPSHVYSSGDDLCTVKVPWSGDF